MRVLSLSGGGYQGLFTALNLARFEEENGPLTDSFDAFVGTSIGAIIAAAGAVGLPIREVVATFESQGEKIFSSRPPPVGVRASIRDISRYLWNAKYDGHHLAVILRRYCGDTRLGDLNRPLLVTAVRLRDGEPVLFTRESHPDALLREVVLASAAAPMVFPPVRVGPDLYADGALFANCPDALALDYAVRDLGADPDRVRLLGVGAMNHSPPLGEPEDANMGIIDWTARNRIFRTLISAQATHAERTVRAVLGDRYARVDAAPQKSESLVIGLDVATAAARGAIHAAADRTAEPMREAVAHLFGQPRKEY